MGIESKEIENHVKTWPQFLRQWSAAKFFDYFSWVNIWEYLMNYLLCIHLFIFLKIIIKFKCRVNNYKYQHLPVTDSLSTIDHKNLLRILTSNPKTKYVKLLKSEYSWQQKNIRIKKDISSWDIRARVKRLCCHDG